MRRGPTVERPPAPHRHCTSFPCCHAGPAAGGVTARTGPREAGRCGSVSTGMVAHSKCHLMVFSTRKPVCMPRRKLLGLLQTQPRHAARVAAARCSNADDYLQGGCGVRCQYVSGWVTERKTQVLKFASQTAHSKILGGRVTRCRLRRRGSLPTAIAIAWQASPKSGSSRIARWRRAVSRGSCTAARCWYWSVGHRVCRSRARTSRVRLPGKASCHESWLARSTGNTRNFSVLNRSCETDGILHGYRPDCVPTGSKPKIVFEADSAKPDVRDNCTLPLQSSLVMSSPARCAGW